MNRVRRGRVALAAGLLMLAGCAVERSPTPQAEPAAETSTPTASEPIAGSPPPSEAAATTPPSPSVPADALLGRTFTDVRSGETFTLAELAADGPVLIEPMAVWCSNCRAQQHEVARAHEAAEFVSVSLDVDLSEAPDDLASYADREGFDWRFAMADADLYRLLQERFGVAATNPPSTPLIVVERDGTVRPLEFGQGIRGVDRLLDELGLG